MKDTPNTIEQVIEPENKNLENEAPTRWENYQQLVQSLRQDKAPPRVKAFMINAIFNKQFPNRRRTKVRLGNIVVDSKPKPCFNCGRKAYYIYYLDSLPKMGFRLCWEHI